MSSYHTTAHTEPCYTPTTTFCILWAVPIATHNVPVPILSLVLPASFLTTTLVTQGPAHHYSLYQPVVSSGALPLERRYFTAALTHPYPFFHAQLYYLPAARPRLTYMAFSVLCLLLGATPSTLPDGWTVDGDSSVTCRYRTFLPAGPAPPVKPFQSRQWRGLGVRTLRTRSHQPDAYLAAGDARAACGYHLPPYSHRAPGGVRLPPQPTPVGEFMPCR